MRQHTPPTAFHEWRLACQQANEAEAALADAWLRYFQAAGSPPSEAARQAAVDLRERATSLYPAAMAESEAVVRHAAKVANLATPLDTSSVLRKLMAETRKPTRAPPRKPNP